MNALLDRLPWTVLTAACLTVGLAPFFPEPHLVEKLRMLLAGKLRKPLDVFDLLMHGAPWGLLLLKIGRTLASR